mgnify:CR=1 FL=1
MVEQWLLGRKDCTLDVNTPSVVYKKRHLEWQNVVSWVVKKAHYLVLSVSQQGGTNVTRLRNWNNYGVTLGMAEYWLLGGKDCTLLVIPPSVTTME